MKLNAIRPIGPHVTGVIRFGSEGQGTEEFRQLDHFEVLGRAYEQPGEGAMPRLKAHPIQAKLVDGNSAEAKLRSIPVRLLFDKPENSLNARYEAFDPQLNRLVCAGDGEKRVRANHAEGKAEEGDCEGPDTCAFANNGNHNCALRVRLAVQIDGQDDPLSVFEVQSSGIHTYRNFAAKLAMLHALAGKRLRGIPLELRMYERGSPAYDFKTFYVADLALRGTPEDALKATATMQGDLAGLEEAVEAMRKDAPFSLSGELDFGILPFRSAPSPRRDARAPQAGQGAKSLEAVVAGARELATGTNDSALVNVQAPAQVISIATSVPATEPEPAESLRSVDTMGEKMTGGGPRPLPF